MFSNGNWRCFAVSAARLASDLMDALSPVEFTPKQATVGLVVEPILDLIGDDLNV